MSTISLIQQIGQQKILLAGKIMPGGNLKIWKLPRKKGFAPSDEENNNRQNVSTTVSTEESEVIKSVGVNKPSSDCIPTNYQSSSSLIENNFINSAKLSHNKQAYGRKGLTSFARNSILCAAEILQRKLGKSCLFLGTATLPALDEEVLFQLQEDWQEICRQFFQQLRRELKRNKACSDSVIYVSEIQTKRSRKLEGGTKILHLHWLYCGRTSSGKYSLNPDRVREIWGNILFSRYLQLRKLPNSSKFESICRSKFVGRCRIEQVKKSASRYISKYISKGEFVKSDRSDVKNNHQAGTWWGISRNLAVAIRASTITLDSTNCITILNQLSCWLSTKLCYSSYSVKVEWQGAEYIVCYCLKVGRRIETFLGIDERLRGLEVI